MEIIKNNGRRCILWLDYPCGDRPDGIPDDCEWLRVVEQPTLSATDILYDTASISLPIVEGSELVWVGGVNQTRDEDYTIDYIERKVYFIGGSRPVVPYDNVVISYISGDCGDIGLQIERPPITSEEATNDTAILNFPIQADSEELFVGGVFLTRNEDYSIDYNTRKIRFFVGNEPILPFENVVVSYIRI